MRIGFPQWNEERFRCSNLILPRIADILCANTCSHFLDTLRHSVQTECTPFQNLSVLCEPMRILVAEDDAPLAEFLHQRLVQEQFSVQVVSNGPEAQQLASDQSYDLVLLDLNLPGAGGLDVLRGIRSKRPDLPVVIVTGASMVEERVRGLDAGRTITSQNRLLSPNLPRAFALFCAEEHGPHARFSRLKISK